MQYKKLSKDQAEQFAKRMDEMSKEDFNNQVDEWSKNHVEGYEPAYDALREDILKTYSTYKDTGDYELDIRVGLCLYKHLCLSNGFTNIVANDDDVWRYLSCVVFPDITHMRYPPSKAEREDNHNINHKRFYSHTRRIWLKTLWWYIHLSWQGSEEETFEVLKNFGTDTISDLYERPGKGYRLKLYRELMKRYSQVDKKSSDLFNEIQKRNLVNCRTIEPALTEGEEEGYIGRLFNELSI